MNLIPRTALDALGTALTRLECDPPSLPYVKSPFHLLSDNWPPDFEAAEIAYHSLWDAPGTPP